MNYIYIIRYSNRIDGEYSCGNFEFAERIEAEAAKKMLADMESMKADNNDGIDEVDSSVRMGKSHAEYCTLEVKRTASGSTDIYKWWVDKVAIAD